MIEIALIVAGVVLGIVAMWFFRKARNSIKKG